MSNSKEDQTVQDKKVSNLKRQLVHLDESIKEKETQVEKTRKELLEYRREFTYAQQMTSFLSKTVHICVRFMRATAGYLLGRRNIKQLYSEAYRVKNASNRLKPYTYHLYNLGFTNKALADLENLLESTTDRYLKRAISWELTLWHTNKYTADGAKRALEYLEIATDGIKEKDQLRRSAIIKAECLERLGKVEKAKDAIGHVLIEQRHPDLYLAAANLEGEIEARVEFINQALAVYQIQPIAFSNTEKEVTYEDLITIPLNKKIEAGPKVSVIFPAYNSETGIQIAIESILSQTWWDIELLIVDDCSTDNTVEVIKQYMEKDERIKLFSTPRNSGPYVARNIALQEATGEYVTINDADDWSHAEKIETQVNHLINNQEIIANTSEHSRLTEDLKLYRRGTPGLYIFSNMSSLLFRREPVMKEIGFWDSVRFAADGEFKRRLLEVFGGDSVVDLKTGPLSLPRQSVTSLTGSSAFGYSGFFMGVRKEYVESLEFHHKKADRLYYPYPQEERPFPVPEPMWPNREAKPLERRHFDIVIAGDFRLQGKTHFFTKEEMKVHKELGLRTGLVQMSCYNLSIRKDIDYEIREQIDGNHVQMLVFGENISCDLLIVKHPETLQEKQTYLSNVRPKMITVVMNHAPTNYELRRCDQQLVDYFGKRGNWYPLNLHVRKALQSDYTRQLRSIKLSSEDWINDSEVNREQYKSRLNDWLL